MSDWADALTGISEVSTLRKLVLAVKKYRLYSLQKKYKLTTYKVLYAP